MEGKGWFIIYGLLFVAVVFLGVLHVGLSQKVSQLSVEIAALKSAQTPGPVPTETPNAVPTPNLSTPVARDERRKADLLQIQEALKEFQEDRRSYPNDLKELTPGALESLPKDPLHPQYTYRYQKTATGFRLTCVLENKEDPEDIRAGDTRNDNIYTLTEKTP